MSKSARRRTALALLAGTTALSLAACGNEDPAAAGAAPADDIAVAASDEACDVASSELPAGVHQFSITNSGSKVTEFYVYAAGDRVMAEVENIAPGVARELRVELPAGEYETVCKPGMIGDGIRSALVVSGEATVLSQDETLAQAGTDYQRYVKSQTGALLEQTTAFTDAVKAGDIEGAKALFPVARTYWERIEPVAESFGDLDPIIDGREGDQAEGEDFTGFHRIEKALWETGDVSDMGPYADQVKSSPSARCSWPTAPRPCSTRSPPARSPVRRTVTATPTCGTSQPTSRAPRPPSRRCGRTWRPTTPRSSPRSTNVSPPRKRNWASTVPVTGGRPTTSSRRTSCAGSATPSRR
jgi:hypothetical protein